MLTVPVNVRQMSGEGGRLEPRKVAVENRLQSDLLYRIITLPGKGSPWFVTSAGGGSRRPSLMRLKKMPATPRQL